MCSFTLPNILPIHFPKDFFSLNIHCRKEEKELRSFVCFVVSARVHRSNLRHVATVVTVLGPASHQWQESLLRMENH